MPFRAPNNMGEVEVRHPGGRCLMHVSQPKVPWKIELRPLALTLQLDTGASGTSQVLPTDPSGWFVLCLVTLCGGSCLNTVILHVCNSVYQLKNMGNLQVKLVSRRTLICPVTIITCSSDWVYLLGGGGGGWERLDRKQKEHGRQHSL